MARGPRTIAQRIELEEAGKVEQQLNSIGKTGEKAFEQIAKAAVVTAQQLEKTVKTVSSLEAAFNKLRAAGAAFGANIGRIGTAADNFANSIGRTVRNTGLLATGVVAAGVGLVKLATSAARSADDLQESAAAAGLSVEAYDRLKFALQTAGVDGEKFDRSMGRLSQQFEEAKKAQTDYAKALADVRRGVPGAAERVQQLSKAVKDSGNAFTRFGIDVRGIKFEDAILKVGDALRRLPSDTARAAAGVEVFGRGGGKIAQGFAGAREQIELTREEFEKLKIPPEALKQADKTSTALDKLGFVAGRVRTKVGSIFDPIIEAAANAFSTVLIEMLPTLEQFARTIALKVIPIVQDLIRLISGQEAQIENKWIITARDSIVAFGKAVKNVFTNVVKPAIIGLVAGLEGVATVINAVFGTNITGAEVGIVLVLAKITGAFGALLAAIKLVAAIGWPVALAAGAVLVLANWEKVRDFFKTFGVDVGDPFKPLTDSYNALIDAAQKRGFGKIIIEDLKDLLKFLLGFDIVVPPNSLLGKLLGLDPKGPPLSVFGTDAAKRWINDFTNAQKKSEAETKKTKSAEDALTASVRAGTTALQEQNAARVARQTAALTASGMSPEAAAASIAALEKQKERIAATNARYAASEKKAADATKETTQAVQGQTQATAELSKTGFRTITIQAERLGATAVPIKRAGDAVEATGKSMVELGTATVTIGEGKNAVTQTGTAVEDLKKKIVDAGTAAVTEAPKVSAAMETATERIKAAFDSLKPAAAPAADGAAAAPAAPATGPFASLVQQAQAAKDAIVAIFQGLTAAIAQSISGGAAVAPGAAGAAVPAAGGVAAAGGVGPFSGLVEAARAAVAAIQQVFTGLSFQAAIQAAVDAAIGKLREMITAVTEVGPAFTTMASTAVAALDQVIQKLNEAIQKARELGQASGTLPGGVGAQPYATGGYTGGGPTNRVAGVVHAGEYVVPARVVRQSGMLGFLEQLRRVGDLDAVLARFIHGFANGGLVPSVNLAPRFAYADGGAVGRPRNLGELTLKNENGMRIGRVWADKETAESLVRYATREAARSGGRKPQRHGAN